MQNQLDNINLTVPREFLTFQGRKSQTRPKLNVSFKYNTPEDVEVFFIGATPTQIRNIHMSRDLVDYVESYVKELVTDMFNVEVYETSAV
jgi:hypothetical protein